MSYYKDKEFQNSCLGGYSRSKQMKGYIDSIRNNILVPIHCKALIDDIEHVIQSKAYQDRLFGSLGQVCVLMDDVVSLARVGNNKAKGYIENTFGTSISSINSWKGSLKLYIEYLKTLVPTVKAKHTSYRISDWNRAVNTIGKIIVECNASNGIESLLAKFGSQENFVKAVVENSYFFMKDDVHDRFTVVSADVQNRKVLYARKSIDVKVQSNGWFHGINENTPKTLDIPISIDPTGNREVQNLITTITGYTVSSGKGSIFQNFIISHIWGKAFDPRNFTNLWNLVIVPAWGNFLLDKTDSQDELTLKMINTFKAIAIKRYKMSKLSWNSIGKCYKDMRPDRKYVIPGTYSIHVIENKTKNGNARPYGAIKQVKVTI